MHCPNCGALEDKVVETRIAKDGDVIRRRRQCLSCGQRFTTYETVIPLDLFVIKRDGSREEFQPDKILAGIKQACWKRNVTEDQLVQIVSKVTSRASLALNQQYEIDSRKIGELVMDELKQIDEVAYVRFASVYRHFKDTDAFISEIQNLSNSPASDQQP